MIEQGEVASSSKRAGRLKFRYKEKVFYSEGGEALEQVALETFKVRLDQALGNLMYLWCPCSLQGS